MEYLLFDVVAFRFTKFILFNNENAQCLFKSMCPPNSTSFSLAQDSNMPQAAAIATPDDTTPPWSLTLLICDWILENRSKSHIWYFKKYQFQYSRQCISLVLDCSHTRLAPVAD